MTDHTTSAQAAKQEAVLTGDEIRRAVAIARSMSGPSDATQPGEYVLAGALAVLSKLRAPVASAEVTDALNWVDDFIARCNRDDRGSCEPVNILRRALASAPVAGEAISDLEAFQWAEKFGTQWALCVPDAIREVIADAQRFAAPQARPSDDDLWDQTLQERDHYHDMADRLAGAIGTYFGEEVGEHSSSHCPWHEALGIIDDAAPQASEAVRDAEAGRDTGKDRLSFHIWALVHGMDITPNDSCGYVSPLTQRAWMRWNPPESAALPAQPEQS